MVTEHMQTSEHDETWRVDRVPHSDVPLFVALDADGAVVFVSLGARAVPLYAFAERHRARLIPETRVTPARRQLIEYLHGRRRGFDLLLRPLGTPFQQRAWAALCDIPYGQTRSYADQARTLGNPAASRAVGRANAQNPLPIVIPCHRVIGHSGSLTGFAGGLCTKRWLLDLETPQCHLWANAPPAVSSTATV